MRRTELLAAAVILALAAGESRAQVRVSPGIGNVPERGNAAAGRSNGVEPGTTRLLDPAQINRDARTPESPNLERRENRLDRREDRVERREDDRRLGDRGRFHWFGDRWWYWMPDNRWVYYDNGAWQDYYAPDQTANNQNYQTYDDRYEFYNGQWWYAMPGGRWDVYADGRWSGYTGTDFPQRRTSGYRGLPDEGRRDENGARSNERGPLNVETPNLNGDQRHIERNTPKTTNPQHVIPQNAPNPGNIHQNIPNPGNVQQHVPNPGNVPHNAPAPVNPGAVPGAAPSGPAVGGAGGAAVGGRK